MPPDPSLRAGRRAVLGGLLAGSLVALAGCGIRLEDDAPRVPLVPARTPLPGENTLLALTNDCALLAATAAAADDELAGSLATLHRRQRTVLRTHLLRSGVGADSLDVPVGPAPTGADATDAALLEGESLMLDRAVEYAAVGADLRPAVTAVLAQRYAAATLLSGSPVRVADVVVGGDAVDEAAASVDAAAYLLQVVAARTSGTRRERASATLASLAGLRTQVAAGGEVPPPVIGHPLPFEVESPADAQRLAVEALTELRATLAGLAAALVEESAGEGLVAASHWLGTAEVLAHRWGVALEPFPGLS